MSILPAHREKDWKLALAENSKNYTQAEVSFVDMDIVWDLDTQFSFNTTSTKVASGQIVAKKLFDDMSMGLCKKTEATLLIIIGKKINGAWVKGECKNYWLKPI